MSLVAIVLFINQQPWATDALCAQTDPDVFHPDRGASTREAKAICAKCPVRAECLDFALTAGERFGVWGGLLSERERRKVTHHVPCTTPGCNRTFASLAGVHCHQTRAHKADAA